MAALLELALKASTSSLAFHLAKRRAFFPVTSASELMVHGWFSVGDLRFNLPEAVDAYSGTTDATSYGPSCPQQATKLPILDGLPAETVEYILDLTSNVTHPSDEDCELQLHRTCICQYLVRSDDQRDQAIVRKLLVQSSSCCSRLLYCMLSEGFTNHVLVDIRRSVFCASSNI